MMAAAIRTNLQLLIAAALIAGCAALRIADPEPVARLRLSAFDAYMRASPRIADPNFPVRIVAIDEASLARFGQWPWPRTLLADLVDQLREAKARTISFDILLAEPDRYSPRELARALDRRDDVKPLLPELAKLPSNDDLLARALASAPTIVGVAGDANGAFAVADARSAFAVAGDDPTLFAHAFPGGVSTLPELTAAAKGVGAVNWVPEGDQIIRRAPLLVSIGGKLHPSLALEALRVGAGQSTIFVKSSGGSGAGAFGQNSGVEIVRVGAVQAPTDARGELWLRFAASDPKRTIPAHRVLERSLDAAEIAGRDILIGATASGLLDLRATPLSASVPGVEVHAQALEQLLSGEHVLRPAYATGAELAFLATAGALVAFAMARSGAVLAFALAAGAICAYAAASWFAYANADLLIDPVYPALATALIYVSTSLTNFMRSESDRARIRAAFSHYVAPELVAEIARHPEKLKLGGEARVVTLLFADVRGFSRLSEGMAAEDVVRFVNRLFTPLAETILKHNGTIDKFMGDAVMAFWNAPVADDDHAGNACRAALAMRADLERLNDDLAAEAAREQRPFNPVRLGVGINTGTCVVGNVGSPGRFDYSALGDAVNVAARFESATKDFDCDIIIGEATAAIASGFLVRELGSVALRGKDRPERVFALVDERVG